MQATRQQILDYLRREGRVTVKELDRLLGLTSTGIRQHLTVLERDGLVEAFEERLIGYLETSKPAIMRSIQDTKDLDEATEESLKGAIVAFKATFA